MSEVSLGRAGAGWGGISNVDVASFEVAWVEGVGKGDEGEDAEGERLA